MTQDRLSAVPTASRRAVLAGAGAVAVAALGGCATYGQAGPVSNADAAGGAGAGTGAGAPAVATGHPSTAAAGADSAGAGAGAGTGAGTGTGAGAGGNANPAALAQTADIPVGGGVVLDAAKLVITQPKAGTFKAFTAVCTHQGCVVSDVTDGTINCPCHGSQFKVADGSVASGPASRALKAVGISVQGTDIVRT